MKFSEVNAIGYERQIITIMKENENAKLWTKMFNAFLYPKNPKHSFTFFVPEYLYIRSKSFCEDISEEIEQEFTPGDLANILYADFLEYVKKYNDLNDIYTRLKAREMSPTNIKPYYTDEVYSGVITEEIRGFEKVKTRIEHRAALKGEFLLRDMLEIYPNHTFTLESILEIVYCDFVDDYRKGLIKRPIEKITQYL